MSSITVGLDRRPNALHSAEVSRSDGRVRAELLSDSTSPDEHAGSTSPGRSIVIAVPDASVMVKNLLVPDSAPSPVDAVAHFELAQSLLEDASQFTFQAIPAGPHGRYLGLIYRLAALDALTEQLGLSSVTAESVTHRARSLALGQGYLTFCERVAGELIGVVDLGGPTASVCLLLQNVIVDLAAVDLRGLDMTQDAGRRQFAIDLKTVINFRRASLQDRGITLPLSTVVLCGDHCDGRLREMVRGYFPAGVEPPRFNRSLFGPDSHFAEVNPELWLVALGLAAN